MNIIISPGSSQVSKEALDLFPSSRVTAGGFREPIKISNLNEDEANFAFEYFEAQGKRVIKEA